MSGNRFIEFFSILTYCCNQLLLFSQLKLTQGSFREFRALQQRFRSIWQTECLKNYGWRFVTLHRRRGSRPSPGKRKCKKEKKKRNQKKCRKAKWLSEEALQIAVKRREANSKGEKERYKHLNAEVQRIARRDKKAFLNDQCKKNRGKQQNGTDQGSLQENQRY